MNQNLFVANSKLWRIKSETEIDSSPNFVETTLATKRSDLVLEKIRNLVNVSARFIKVQAWLPMQS